jgi:diaminopimelate decarboxylase
MTTTADRKAKAMGPIPPGFAADTDGMLLISGERADALVDRAGDTPLFVYDAGLLSLRIAQLRVAMPPVLRLHFAMKANPHPDVVRYMAARVDGIDIASAGELSAALAAGADPRHISFAGPGKRDVELAAAIAAGVTLNVESEGEAARALTIAAGQGVRPRLAVRVNPDFDLKGSGMRMGGGAKAFGVDADRVPALVRHLITAGADWQGFHIFAGSQALDADAIIECQAATIDLAARLADSIGHSPPLVNLGGGLGVPYFAQDSALDLSKIGTALNHALAARPDSLADSNFAMELGRFLAAEAGVYLCRIVDRKESCGEIFLVTDGGLHHQLAASGNFGTVVRRNYPIAIANKFDADRAEIASVVGCLCTPLDKLGDQVALPMGDVGDLVAIFLAGAYGASASPAAFLGHPPARELLIGV